jgi:nonribosomal peptide synthetase DhbF
MATTEDLAYVIYTSGSTGVPKGAMLPHRAVLNYLEWMRRELGLLADDCVLQKAPLSFDASVWELYLPLMSGARVFLARPDGQRDPAYLTATLRHYGVTIVQFVPSLLAVLLETPGFAKALRGLRHLVLGGEALSSELAARVRLLLPDGSVYNLYGPTEAAVYATAWMLPPEFRGGVVPIGRPIFNVKVYLFPPGGWELLPIGATGELCIGGRGVGIGYWKQPELTAERFVADPFDSGKLLYRTGDLARWRADGVLEFLGRIDQQVKIRGYRVELGEVEAALLRHPGVRECAVTSGASARGDGRLIAYLVPETGQIPAAAQLRAHLAARLPDFMVPSAFVVMQYLPLNANGKLDRAALPIPDESRAQQEYIAPRTRMEALVAQTWAEVLGLDRVGVEEDFFNLGGHSLHGMRILARLGSTLDRRLSLRLLFSTRSVAALASGIEAELALPPDPDGTL